MVKIYNEIIKESIFKEKLDNGLTVLMMPRAGYNKNYGIFAANCGSIDNKFYHPETNEPVEVPDGIAHFLEHKLFESQKEDVFSAFASLGASANAFTNYNMTAYLFHTSDNFLESLETLIDFVQDPYFTDENVEKEKGIIAQEIKMYDDDPDYQVYKNMITGLYHQFPIRIDIAGTVDSIYKIKKEDLNLCYNTFYNPGNMLLFLTGNFDPDKVIEIIKEKQIKKDLANYPEIKRIYPDEPAYVNQKIITKKMDVSQPLFRLGIKETLIPDSPAELVKQEIGTLMLLDLLIGKSTGLYQDLYTEGLLDDYYVNYYVLEKEYGYAVIGGRTRDPDLLFERIRNGLRKGIKEIKTEDFDRIYRKTLGEFIENFNSFETVATEFISYYFKGINFFEIMDIIKEIDLEYLYGRFEEFFREDRFVRSIINGD
ncbi:MAG: insulinase family protein [Halanaerobiaceae bacterium]|nr:insulinase family protein [Halanaerobiaceae bacterium]